MSLYGIECKINGVPCAMVTRGPANGAYRAVFERGADFPEGETGVSLEDIEAIQWDQPEIEGDCLLPAGYGFTVEDIQYGAGTRSYTVALQVGRQYLGDVTGYAAQVEELNQTVADQAATIREQEQAAAEREAELNAAYQEGVESNG